ncbi:MAG: GAF domain-containing protein, partial [Planctomycetota bacterium]
MNEANQRVQLLGDLTALRSGIDGILGELRENAYLQRVLAGMAEAGQGLLVRQDLDTAIREAVEAVGRHTDFDDVAVTRREVRPDGEQVFESVHRWTRRPLPEEPFAARRLGAEHWLRALERGEVVRARADEQPPALRRHLAEVHVGSLLTVPIPGRETYWGALVFTSIESDRAWSAAEEALLIGLAASLGGAVTRHQAAERERAMAGELAEARRVESLALLARGVAHDFGNVLQVLSSHVEMLARDDGDTLQTHLEPMGAALAAAQDLVGKLECCGVGVIAFDMKESNKILEDKLNSIRGKADCIVTACPACFLRLDAPPQPLKELSTPVIHISELLCLAFGIPPEKLFFEGHMTDVSPLIEGLK